MKVERDAQELADTLGVKIFQADIIYHLFDKFTAYREELKQKKREEFKNIAVFPCKLKVCSISTRSLHVKTINCDCDFVSKHLLLNILNWSICIRPQILPQFIFNSRDPIVMGVMVENGIVREGTPVCVPSKEVCN